MTVMGYARVSTIDQDLSIHQATAEGGGLRGNPRREQGVLPPPRVGGAAFLRKGDVLMVTRIDRFARSIGGLQDIVPPCVLGAPASRRPSSRSTPARRRGSASWTCGVFAEFETNLRRERQLEGIARAKAAGVYKGRPPSIEAARVREMKAQGMRPVDVAKALQIGRASVYRVLGQKADH
jgi:DNA invertase Pin-like site-specific DNA recombinase